MIERMHLGARVKHLREYRKISSSDMAKRLEMDHTQYLNTVEGTEQIADWVLDRISNELDFPADYIRDWMENPINIIQNNNDSAIANGIYGGTYHQTFHPLDKIVELYERLLALEKEKAGNTPSA